MTKKVVAIESSGNIYEDLGFDKAEAAALLERSRLMLQVIRALRDRPETQKQIGTILGIGQSRVSDLMKGKAKLFSLEMLLTFAMKLGMRVNIDVAQNTSRAVKSPNRSRGLSRSTPTIPSWWQSTSLLSLHRRVQFANIHTTPTIAIWTSHQDSVAVSEDRVRQSSATQSNYGQYAKFSSKLGSAEPPDTLSSVA